MAAIAATAVTAAASAISPATVAAVDMAVRPPTEEAAATAAVRIVRQATVEGIPPVDIRLAVTLEAAEDIQAGVVDTGNWQAGDVRSEGQRQKGRANQHALFNFVQWIGRPAKKTTLDCALPDHSVSTHSPCAGACFLSWCLPPF